MLVLHHLEVPHCWLIFQSPEHTDVRLAESCGRLLVQMCYDRNCQETILGTENNFKTTKKPNQTKMQHRAVLLPRPIGNFTG